MSRGRQAAPVSSNGRQPQRGPSTGAPIAALVSIVGLVLIMMGSVFVMSTFAFNGGSNGPTQAPGDTSIPTDKQRITPNPVVVITPPPDQRPSINGTLLFARTGNIWAASGLDLKPVSSKGTDSGPTWAPNGKSFYVVETIRKDDVNPPFHAGKYYLFVTNIAQMNADGSGRTDVYKSLFSTGSGQWYTGVYQPDVSPDGKTFALVSDFGWVPTDCLSCFQPVELATMTTSGKNLTNLHVKDASGLGHNDPAWSPDGKTIAFTYDDRAGADGAPRIGLLTYKTGALSLFPRKGYADPAWSPDGSMIAAERVSANGRDIVILGAKSGAELARLTNDDNSFAPVWSPNGDQIAFLHRHNLGVDLEIMTLDINAGGITLVDIKPVTEDGSIDPSPPAWFIPADQRKPPPTPPSNAVVTPVPATIGPTQITPSETP